MNDPGPADTVPSPTGEPYRAGFVAILGLPNVGKSTLLNALVGERLSIVTPKAQTTQRKLRGIWSDEAHQAVFIDTPGILDPRYLLQRSMREEALSAVEDADVVVLVVDAGFEPSVEWVEAFAPSVAPPRILCINKCDLVSQAAPGEIETRLGDVGWTASARVSASGGVGVEALRAAILGALPESPPLYPVDDLSDVPVRDFVAEMIRETCLEELDQEVPYSIAVRIEEFHEREGGRPTFIEAVIFVERESQKGIVVGKGGRTIRGIGSRSREKIEAFLDHPVYLELRVKVLANWRKRAGTLRVLGFRVPAEESR